MAGFQSWLLGRACTTLVRAHRLWPLDTLRTQIMPDVLEVNRIDELAEYRPAWHSLMAKTPGATFFQSLEWLETFWRHNGQGKTLRVLIVSDRGNPIGILPLLVLREKTKVGPVRVLTYPLHDWGSTYGPIGADAATTLAAGL